MPNWLKLYYNFDKALLMAITQAVGRRLQSGLIRLLFPLYRAFGGFKMIRSLEVLSSVLDCEVINLGSNEKVFISAPISIQHDFADAIYSRMVGQWFIQAPYIIIAQDARLLGPFATALTRNKGILSDTIAPENYQNSHTPASLFSLLMALIPSGFLQYLSGYWCSLVSLWSRSYFHWLVETLPRLYFVESWKETTGISVKFIIDARPPEWQFESLHLLGISDKDIMVWNNRGALVQHLVVPSFPRRLCLPGRKFSVVSPSALRWVRARILSALNLKETRPKAWPRRIVISRRMAPGRRVVNEEEMLRFLKHFGFQAFCLEQLSFKEQVELFSNAEVVIAPHGAGLANIIFASHLKVIELFGSYMNPSFFTLSSTLGFEYAFLKCDSIPTIHPHRDNMRVDLDALAELLSCLGISR